MGCFRVTKIRVSDIIWKVKFNPSRGECVNNPTLKEHKTWPSPPAPLSRTYVHSLVEIHPKVGVHHSVSPLVAVALVNVVVDAGVSREAPARPLLFRRAREHEVEDVEITLALGRVD